MSRIAPVLGTMIALLALTCAEPCRGSEGRPARVEGSGAAAAAGCQDDPARAGDSVRFELKNAIIFVKATVNGEGPLTFIFDTGASMTVLKPGTAERLGLVEKSKDEPAPKRRLRPGALTGEGARLVEIDSIAVGKAAAKQVQAAVMAVPQADVPLNQLGISYDGILGYTFISRFVSTLDYKGKTLRLVPSDYMPEAPAIAAAPAATLGFSYRTIPDDLANEIGVEGGLEVRSVSAEGPASKAGLKKGDIVREVNGKRVDTADHYRKLLGSIQPGDAVVLKVVRDRKDVDLRLTAGTRP